VKPSRTASNAPTDPLIGQSVHGRSGAQFEIDHLIGRGGVGLVYKARQSEPARDVVVKVLAPHWQQDPDALARFDREAERLAALHHPNIVEMYDYGHADGRSYLVMEYLQGELLSDHVARKQQLSLEEFVPVAAQVLKGIGHAHSREMMVRDVKPANIMLCERKGRANFVKILDFGLAKLLRGERAITEEHVLGTVGYVAPEAIKGEPTDLRVDVYAIGVLFFYMLAGRLPFEDESNTAIFYKTVHDDPPDLRVVLGEGSGVPEGVIALIESCLAKNPDDRPSDANHVVEQLIDVVPASLFRLPRTQAGRVRAAAVAPHAGNTGMIELIGADRSETAELQLDAEGATPPSGFLRSEPPTLSTRPSGAEVPEPADPRAVATPPEGRLRTRLVALSVAAGALLTIVVFGVVAVAIDDDEPREPIAHAAASPSQANATTGLAAELDAAESHIAAGELGPADDVLDRVRAAASDEPGLRTRLHRLETRLLVERLVVAAEKLEQEGDVAAAIGAYRDALQADPTHERSRKALARLTAATTDDEPATRDRLDRAGDKPRGSGAVGKGERRRGKKNDAGLPAVPATEASAEDSPEPAKQPERKGDGTFLSTKKPRKGDDPFLPTGKTP
jgi:serine/threonine protein kinase